jgi:putative acetyltransferase
MAMETSHPARQIYPATKDSFVEIVALWEASVRHTHHFLSEADIQFFKPLILNEFLAMVELFATKNKAGAITGFIGIAHGKVEMLFVHPQAAGKGIGRQLLQFAINEKQVWKVDVNEQNPQAVGFYRHMGFHVVTRTDVDGMGKPFPLLQMEL